MTVHISDAFVSTPDIPSVGDINLQNPGTYRIAGIGPGPTTWQLSEVTSPYVHGSTLVAARKEQTIMPLTILVEGDSQADLIGNVSLLCRAFEQFRYRVGFKWDGVEYEWYCRPVNHQMEGEGAFNGSLLRVEKVLMTFQIPREPIPIEGPF